MATAVLVLAILADVFGALAAIVAFFFSATLVGLSGGVAGRGAASGSLLALLAVAIGITGTALATRRPRLAGGLCLIAATLGTVGTFAFVLSSVLYLVAGVLGLFVRPLPLTQPASDMSVPHVAPTAVVHRPWPQTWRMPGRRALALMLATIVLVIAGLGGAALAQPAEQRPVRALLEGLQKADDIALANVLAPGQRGGSASKDAEAALLYGLGRSEIGFLNADWLRRLGPATGTIIIFENLTLTTTAKSADAAVVHVRGVFAPSNENGIIHLVLQGVRQPFDAHIAVTSVGGTWYVTNTGNPPAPAAAPHQPVVGVRTPTSAPSPASTPIHLAVGTYAAPASVSDINGWRLTLRDVTVNVDESVVFDFDLQTGTVDYAWAARDSRLELRSGTWLTVIAARSTFYDGGNGVGVTIPVRLAFPAGLAGKQPYVIRICGNLGYCWAPLPGPVLREY